MQQQRKTSTGPEPNTRYILYTYPTCEPSRKLLMDLQQLPEQKQLKIEVIDIRNVLDSDNYPPNLTMTPCLWVTNTQLPTVHNGRRAILLFFEIRAHDIQLDENKVYGKIEIQNKFNQTELMDMDEHQGKISKLDMTRIQKDFEMIGEGTSNKNVNKNFESFIDDPTIADDPRLNRDPKHMDLDALKASRGYA